MLKGTLIFDEAMYVLVFVEQYARTQKNKATEHHLGLLKAKIAKLKRDLLEGGVCSWSQCE
jgi:ribosome-interacting GTPase 1